MLQDAVTGPILVGAAIHDSLQGHMAERMDVRAQVDAVGRIMDARCDDPIKITEKQCEYLLNKESAWERGEITQAQFEAEERRIIWKR